MTQVTIYLEDDTLAAAKEAAAKAKLSVSKWFAQFAEAAKTAQQKDWQGLWAEIDRLRLESNDDEALDVLLNPQLRYADLGTDTPIESWE